MVIVFWCLFEQNNTIQQVIIFCLAAQFPLYIMFEKQIQCRWKLNFQFLKTAVIEKRFLNSFCNENSSDGVPFYKLVTYLFVCLFTYFIYFLFIYLSFYLSIYFKLFKIHKLKYVRFSLICLFWKIKLEIQIWTKTASIILPKRTAYRRKFILFAFFSFAVLIMNTTVSWEENTICYL